MAIATPGELVNTITGFLASNPTPEQIIAYRLPESLAQRAHELAERNRHNLLAADERAEMDEFMRMEHFMTILKAKVRLSQAKKA